MPDGSWASDTDNGVEGVTYEDWHGCDVDPDGGVWSVGGKISSRPLTRGVVGYQGDSMPPRLALD
jgi:hypothetical protein